MLLPPPSATWSCAAPAIGATGACRRGAARLRQPTAVGSRQPARRPACGQAVLDRTRTHRRQPGAAGHGMLALAAQTVLPNVDDLRSAAPGRAKLPSPTRDVESTGAHGSCPGATVDLLDGANLLHRCNTGALAGRLRHRAHVCRSPCARSRASAITSGSTGAAAAARAHPPHSVGIDDTARDPMHLIADNAAGHLLRTGRVTNAVIFGADRVAATAGDDAPTGSAPTSWPSSRENGIPVYAGRAHGIARDVDLDLADGDAIPTSRGARRTGDAHRGVAAAPAGVRRSTTPPDVTPLRYHQPIVTGEGTIAARPSAREVCARSKPPPTPAIEPTV